MELAPRLELKQKVSMSPEAYQGLAMLSMPAAELLRIVEVELERNPALEADDPEPDQLEQVEERELDAEVDRAWDEWLADYEEMQRLDGVAERDPDAVAPDMEDFVAALKSLDEHLREQVALSTRSDKVARAADIIIGLLDDDGFFTGDFEEVSRLAHVDIETAEAALALIQELDPPGIGARDVREALAIQARIYGVLSPLLAAIIERHLDAVAADQLRRIARDEGVTESEVAAAVEALRILNPRPAGSYSSGEIAAYVVPDVIVWRSEGEWIVVPNTDSVPTLRVSPRYRALLRDRARIDESTRRYLTEHVRRAEAFIRNLDRRKETIVRIAEVIIETQREFFETDRGALRPLRLEDVAVEIGVHLSTVSRGVTGKYMATPYGMFELKHFFSGGFRTRTGLDVASTTVKQRIRSLIDAEDKQRPLSDQMIAGILIEEGVPVARRTVAKYREEMSIGPSWARKRRSGQKARHARS